MQDSIKKFKPNKDEINDFFNKIEDKEQNWLLKDEQIRIIAYLMERRPSDYVEMKHYLKGILPEVKRLTKKYLNKLQQENETLRIADSDEEPKKELIRNIYKNIPIKFDGEIPLDYKMVKIKRGRPSLFLRKFNKDDELVLIPIGFKPLIISSVVENLSTKGETYFELIWPVLNHWKKDIIEQTKAFNSNKLPLAVNSFGFPVLSSNATLMVNWLASWLAVNEKVIPKKITTNQMGWLGENLEHGFMVGDTQITKGNSKVEFAIKGDGRKQLSEGFYKKGTLERWKKAINLVSNYPLIKLAVYASLAPPLLRVIRQSGFTIDWSYKTSNGKTTALSVAGSCWGDPNPHNNSSVISSWSATNFSIEVQMSVLNNLPMILDDTKQAPRKFDIPNMLYSVASGQSKGLGMKDGSIREKRKWRTIMLSSGESRAVDFDKSGGSVARTVTLWASPFNNDNVSDLIKNLTDGINDNFGHAGPAFVEWIINNLDEKDNLIELFNESVINIREKTHEYSNTMDKNVLNRLSNYLSILYLAGLIFEEIFNLNWEPMSTIYSIIPIACGGFDAVDREKEALIEILSYAQQNPHRMCLNAEQYETDKNNGGWLGYYDKNDENWEYIAFFKDALEEFLEKKNYETKSILKQWVEARWMKKDGKNLSVKVRKLPGSPRMIAVKRSIINELDFFTEDDL